MGVPLKNYPNILYIHSHDTGRYVQPYGHPITTPNIQQLAEQGMVFRQAFCAAPTCSASRAALLTGQYPHSNGMLGLAHRGFSLNDYQQHIVHTLDKLGYHSILIGEQHISKKPDAIGYDQVYKIASSHADIVAPLAEDVLHTISTKQPFFLSVGFFETHRAFPPPLSTHDALYSAPPPFLPDTPQTRQDMAEFKASAWALDRGIGIVLNALEANGLTDNTLVICTTDHGIAFPGAKATLKDHGTGVMLIMRGPGGFLGGQISDALVSQIDLFPTICDLLHIEQPAWLQGSSLLPLVNQECTEIHEAIFAEATYHAAYEPQRAIRTKHWKYIRRFDNRKAPVLANVDDGLSKDTWLEQGWETHPVAQEQLYNLTFDPTESNNLAKEPTAAIILAGLREQLTQWMIETDDPLLCGPVEAPHGAELNDPDQLSPTEPTHIV